MPTIGLVGKTVLLAEKYGEPLDGVSLLDVDGSISTEVPKGGNSVHAPSPDAIVDPGKVDLSIAEPDLVVPKNLPKSPDVSLKAPVVPERQFYDVLGTTFEEVVDNLATAHEHIFAEHGHGATVYQFLPDAQAFPAGPIMYIQWITGDIAIKTILPNWKDKDLAAPCLRENWEEFMTGLELHEAGHATITKRFNAIMKSKMTMLNQYKDPGPGGDMEAAFKKALKATEVEILKKHKEYDEKTKNGKLQGATFRPCT